MTLRTIYRYDRAEVRRVLETSGLAEARAQFPDQVVAPIARALGLTLKYRPRNNWNPEWNALLGTKPDGLLAGELGAPAATVAAQRRKLGIPAFDESRARVMKTQAVLDALRALPDVDLMQRLSVIKLETRATSAQIAEERQRRGLDGKTPYGRRSISFDALRLTRLRKTCILAMRAEFPGITLDAIGAVLGVTRERVRQIDAYVIPCTTTVREQ